MLKLYERQQKEVDYIIKNKFLYLCASTGWGKSFVILGLKQQVQERVNIICPAHLISQWESYCNQFNIPYSVVAKNGFGDSINIVSVQWLTRNAKAPKKPNPALPDYKQKLISYKEGLNTANNLKGELGNGYLVIDEFHRVLGVTSEIYKIMQRITPTGNVYLSATPIEHGAWDFYPAIRTNPQIYNRLKGKAGFQNWTEFKTHFCQLDPYVKQNIQGINPKVEEFFRKLIHVRKHVNNEDSLIKESRIEIKYPEDLRGWLMRAERNLGGIQGFTIKRQLLNFFAYDKDTDDYCNLSNLYPVKINAIRSLLSKINTKAVIFYEFEAEKKELETLDGIYFVKGKSDKILFEVDKFLKSDCQAIAFQYRQLGEGVRLSFCHDIIFYTVCVSNKLAKQSAGRAMFAGRTDPIRLHRFITDHPFEMELLKMLDDKQREVNKFMNLDVEEI